MILYGSFTSPYVRHCRIELISQSTPFEFIETDYAGSDKGSPTKRVPYLHDGDLMLTDSSSILMHLRHKARLSFIETAQEMEHYSLASTAQDAAINLFLLEREGQTPSNNEYLERQSQRVMTSLAALNDKTYSDTDNYTLAEVRTACLLAWGLYRERFEITEFNTLKAFLAQISDWQPFADTVPPAM